MVVPAHTLYRKNCTHHPSARIGTAFEQAMEIHTWRIFCTCKLVFGSSSKGCKIGLNWKTCIYKGKSSSTFANTDVNQEYAFDSRWCYTAQAGNRGQNRDLECCQVEAMLGWYLFWNPIETIISKFIKQNYRCLNRNEKNPVCLWNLAFILYHSHDKKC